MRPLRTYLQTTNTWNPASDLRERIRYIDVSAVSHETLQIRDLVSIPSKEAPGRARKIVHRSDTIIATIRPGLKRVAQVPPHLHDEVASTAFCVLRPDVKQIDPDYLFYLVSSDNFIESVVEHETGASYPAVRDRDVLDQSVEIPSLEIQEKIAKALEVLRKSYLQEIALLAKAQELKKATMQQLFTRGLRGESQKETEIGLMPESWVPTEIGNFSRQTQYGLSVRGEAKGTYPILRMNCQSNGKVILRDLQYVNLDEKTFNAFALNNGDVLFNRTNSIEHVGRTALFSLDVPAVFASYLIRVQLDHEKCLPAYLNHFMNWPTTQSRIKSLASRAVGQANINATKLRTVLVPLPSTCGEQAEVVAVLDAIDQKIALHQKKQTVLEELFQALLHKLMTGEISVNDLDLTALQDFAASNAASAATEGSTP